MNIDSVFHVCFPDFLSYIGYVEILILPCMHGYITGYIRELSEEHVERVRYYDLSYNVTSGEAKRSQKYEHALLLILCY